MATVVVVNAGSEEEVVVAQLGAASPRSPRGVIYWLGNNSGGKERKRLEKGKREARIVLMAQLGATSLRYNDDDNDGKGSDGDDEQ
ncbi:hypothetical protein BHM03_00015244 [Ensete ventricosum]|nr:hypothetical protein BHM03_00015244 [Ensete ventricosum]